MNNTVVEYLYQHRDDFGLRNLEIPNTWHFAINSLPKNEILNNDFYKSCSSVFITLNKNSKGEWNLIK